MAAEQIESELAHAQAARAAQNEGQARVRARRAAGIAIRAWYRAHQPSAWRGDAVQQLRRLQAETRVPEAVRAAAARLTTKVDPDHRLPFDEDPIQDARAIIEFLAGHEP